MDRRTKTHPLTIILILMLPAVAVLAHDIWFMTDPSKPGLKFTRPFELSDLGWLWVMYGPKSFKFFHEAVPKSLWDHAFDPLLRCTAVYILLVLPLFGFIYHAFRFFRAGKGPSDKFVSFSFRDPNAPDDGERLKYKRK